MRDVPCDIEGPQLEFEEAVCSLFDDPDGCYEVLDRNTVHDPFEPDIVVMDEDEWVFTVLCYYTEDVPANGLLELFPTTFGMRKWIEDSPDRPAFLAFGAGGTPTHPEVLYFARFFNFSDPVVDMDTVREHIVNWMRPSFFDAVIKREFERIFSPS